MAIRRKHDILIIIALVLAGVAYASLRTEFRLQPDMPPEFFDPSQLPAAKRAGEERIARAYWNCAVKQVQWKYGYASRLPDEPPPEFGVAMSELGPVAKDEVVRRRYWARLRGAWHLSSVWNSEYVWSAGSFRQSLRTAGDWWAQLTRTTLGQ